MKKLSIKEKKKAKDQKSAKSRNRRQTYDSLKSTLLGLNIISEPVIDHRKNRTGNFNTTITLISEEKCEFPDEWKIVNQTEACNEQRCPFWTQWAAWGDCSTTCGTNGTQSRNRDCKLGVLGDLSCPMGGDLETQSCNEKLCPRFSEWSDWSECPVTCGGAIQLRARACENGALGEIGCDSEASEEVACGIEPCPIYWAEWSEWSECSEFCGEGEITRNRTCLNAPNSTYCGSTGDKEAKPCNNGYCSGDFFAPHWGEWGDWGECSQTCGEGRALRSRNCTGDTIGSKVFYRNMDFIN